MFSRISNCKQYFQCALKHSDKEGIQGISSCNRSLFALDTALNWELEKRQVGEVRSPVLFLSDGLVEGQVETLEEQNNHVSLSTLVKRKLWVRSQVLVYVLLLLIIAHNKLWVRSRLMCALCKQVAKAVIEGENFQLVIVWCMH